MDRVRGYLGTARAVLGVVSPLGWTVVALGVVGWIAGVWWGWSEAMVFAGVALVLLVLAIAFTIGRIELSATIGVEPARVVVGDRAAGELTVTNRRRRAARSLRLELPGLEPPNQSHIVEKNCQTRQQERDRDGYSR